MLKPGWKTPLRPIPRISPSSMKPSCANSRKPMARPWWSSSSEKSCNAISARPTINRSGHSRDGCPRRCRDGGAGLPLGRCVPTDDVSNAGYACSLCIAALDETCEWVMLSDADDLMNKDSLIRLLADLKSEKSDVVLGGVDAIWDTGKPSERADYIKRLIAEYPKNKTSILFSWVGPIGKAIRKQLIVENGLKFESRLASYDVVFAARLASL